MTGNEQLRSVVALISKFLLWCLLLGFALLLLWFLLFLLGGDFAYGIHGDMFDLTKHEFDVMNYHGMALLKMTIFVFFLIPWIATRIVLRGLNEK